MYVCDVTYKIHLLKKVPAIDTMCLFVDLGESDLLFGLSFSSCEEAEPTLSPGDFRFPVSLMAPASDLLILLQSFHPSTANPYYITSINKSHIYSTSHDIVILLT